MNLYLGLQILWKHLDFLAMYMYYLRPVGEWVRFNISLSGEMVVVGNNRQQCLRIYFKMAAGNCAGKNVLCYYDFN